MKKKWFLTMILCLVPLVFFGCKREAEQLPVQKPEASMETSALNGSESGDGENTASLLQKEVHEEWSTNVRVDADVSFIDSKRLPTYTGSLRIFTVEELAKALKFSPESAISSTTTNEAHMHLGVGPYTYLEFENNSFLICSGDSFQYCIGDTYNKMINLLEVIGREDRENLFLTGDELNFATREKALTEIETVLDELGIPVMNQPKCLTVDYAVISAEKDNPEGRLREQVTNTFLPDKEGITEDDSCYMFYYTIAANSMPVSRSASGVYGDGSLLCGTELIACYNKDGLVGISLTYQPLTETQSEAQPVIPLEEILEKERAKYDAIITQGDYLINEIRLEYIAQPRSIDENAVTLIPVWRFYIEHSYVQEGAQKGGNTAEDFLVKESTWDVFDAITGEMLPFSQ